MIHVSALVLAALVTAVPGPGAAAACLAADDVTSDAIPGHADAIPAHPEGTPTRGPAPTQAVDETLEALYRSGISYETFLADARARVELWHANTERSAIIDASLVERARAVDGTWHLLAVAVDSCSDSVSIIPWLAGLVAEVDGLDLRIVDPTAGRSVMEAHRTPDGRAATPTVLLLNETFEEAGCFIERPPALQEWIRERPGLSSEEVYEGKMAWYDEDRGRGTVEALVEMLEAASEGDSICR